MPQGHPLAQRIRTHRLTRAALLAAAIVGAVLSGLWLARTMIVERVLTAMLADRLGLTVALEVIGVDFDSLEIKDLRIGRAGGMLINRVEVAYAFGELMGGGLRSIQLRGVRARATVGPDGVSAGALDTLFRAGTGGPSGPPRLPLTHFDDAAILVATPYGPAALEATGAVVPVAENRLRLEAKLSLTGFRNRVSGSVAATVAEGGAVAGHIMIGPGDLELGPDAAVRALAGAASLERTDPNGALAVVARLGADGVRLGRVNLGDASASLDLNGSRATLDAAAESADGRARASLAASAEPIGAAPLQIAAEGDIEASADAEVWRLLPLPPGLRVGGGRAHITLALTGTPPALTGDLRLSADVADVTVAQVSAESAALALQGLISMAEDRLTLTPMDGGSVRLADLSARLGERGRVDLVEPVTVPIRAAEGAVVETLGGDAGYAFRHDLAFGAAPFTARLVVDGEGRAVTGTTPDARLAGAAGAAPYAGTLTLENGTLRLPDWQLALDGVGGTVTIAPRDPERGPLARLFVGAVTQQSEPPAVVPLSLEASLDRTEGELRFDGALRNASGRLHASFQGRHDPATGAGGGELALRKLVFGVGIAGPETLFPVLHGRVRETSGALALAGNAAWSADGVEAEGRLLVDDFSAAFGDVELKRANTVLDIDTRESSAGPPRQEIAIGALDIGLPLTDGLVALRIFPDGRLQVEEMRWGLAGGQVRARDFTLDPRAARQALRLDVDDVAFARLLALFKLEGVQATGVLDGQVPVTIVGNDILIDNGELAAERPGVIRYDPAQYPAGIDAGGQGMQLALQALENFHYDTLRLTLNRQLGGESVITLHIKGRNPDLYEGHPVVLNLNLSGQIDQIVQRSLEGYRVPDRIRRRILDFTQ